MSILTITRVTTLPKTLAANTIYIVKADGADLSQMYFTNSDGSEVRHLLGLDEVYTIANQSVSNQRRFFLVNDLTEMVGLTLIQSSMVFVKDTSTEATPNAGPGWYVFDSAARTFSRVNLGGVSSWDDIQQKPTSTVEQIDSAVRASHTHSNKEVLDQISQNPDGAVCYNGKPLVTFTGMEW